MIFMRADYALRHLEDLLRKQNRSQKNIRSARANMRACAIVPLICFPSCGNCGQGWLPFRRIAAGQCHDAPPKTFANIPEFPWICHDFRHENDMFPLCFLRKCFIINERGEGGIRTLGTLLGYGALAKRCFRPLSHLTKNRL
jgi:hypothetical protein